MLANNKMNTTSYSFFSFWGYYFSAGLFAMTEHPKENL